MGQTLQDVLAMPEVADPVGRIGVDTSALDEWIAALHLIGATVDAAFYERETGTVWLATSVGLSHAMLARRGRPTTYCSITPWQQVGSATLALVASRHQTIPADEWILSAPDQQMRLAVRHDEWARLAPLARAVVERVGPVNPSPEPS